MHEHVLRPFALALFADVRRWCLEPGRLAGDGQWQTLGAMFKDDKAWLALPSPPGDEHIAPAPATFSLQAVQAGIARSFPDGVTHGALVLLRVTDAQRARCWLANTSFSDGACSAVSGAIYKTVALTYGGLAQLGAPAAWRKTLPQEFVAGMAARASLLGDLHGNHPDHWTRPPRNWPPQLAGTSSHRGPPPRDPAGIAIVLPLRVGLSAEEVAHTGPDLAAVLREAIAALHDDENNGLEVLSVEAMRHHPQLPGDAMGRDHFGYVDGLSQPSLDARQAPSRYWHDRVEPGELLLGYGNNRGDEAGVRDTLRANGSFLVVRKLRQHTERFEHRLKLAIKNILPDGDKAAREALREILMAKLMGRHTNGKPLTGKPGLDDNDFNFRDDRRGAHCPLQSHIRRSNPREPVPPLMTPPPRIARRGMSYGPRRGEGRSCGGGCPDSWGARSGRSRSGATFPGCSSVSLPLAPCRRRRSARRGRAA